MAETERINPELEALKEAVDREHNTTGMTLPNVAAFQDVEAEKYGAAFREAVLNPEKTDTVIDDSGMTMKEYVEMTNFGIPPSNALPQVEAKHSFETKEVEGQTVIEITAPPLPEETAVVPETKVLVTAPVAVSGKEGAGTKDPNAFTRMNAPVVPVGTVTDLENSNK